MTKNQDERLVVAFENIALALSKLSDCVDTNAVTGESEFAVANGIFLRGTSDEMQYFNLNVNLGHPADYLPIRTKSVDK